MAEFDKLMSLSYQDMKALNEYVEMLKQGEISKLEQSSDTTEMFRAQGAVAALKRLQIALEAAKKNKGA